ncbi:MAG TPA: SusD/RagB family nutrient-binding outer membrane lipoprotein [Hanamia sp.]
MKNIFLNIHYYIGILCGIALFTSCTKNYSEINTDQNNIAAIGPAEVPFLFSEALAAVPIGGQTQENLFADQYAQYFACNATYFPTDRLVIKISWAQTAWDPIYTKVVPQLQKIFESTDSTSAEYALANIWWVYAFHRVTDYFGPIPYFNVGKPASSVPYDPQDKIYNDFFKRLDAAVSVLKGRTSESPFGNYDIIYGGNVSKWIKFANTLRLRLAIRISNVDPVLAKAEGEAAYADGVCTVSPADDALLKKNLIDINPISRMSEWNEFRMSASMESILKGYEDPRISQYFIPAVNSGTYEGLRNGLSIEQLGLAVNKPEANSHVGPRWASPASGGIANYLSTPLNVISTAEAYFLRAEGALLGWNMGGTAKVLYEAGITNSFMQWGITDNTVIQAYINGVTTPIAPGDYLNSPPLATVPVKFNSTDVNIQLEQIAIQKWLALFPDGVEAWADFRRSHVLPLYPVANSDNLDITNTSTQWIRRIPFLLSEEQNNGAEIPNAIKLLGGPDKITSPLWWDKH